ncbi:ketoacyl-ACP synthase III family protein [Streptomyces sp. NPDC053048]|uniref:ketoacyl-ACP synthase III family protein n=1 Tax=Streptomyces sp. NPDC053048 TaxID=3365694 RepID=UPI0037D40C8C
MKPVEPVGIAAAALWLPEGRARMAEAVADGRLRARQAKELGHPEVPEAGPESAPGMAVDAARAALRVADIEAKDLDICAHAWMYYQGHDLWSPAHYIAHELGAHRALPVGIQQVCNGGAAGVELTVARLTADANRSPDGYRWGTVTTGDRFTEPGFDRWTSDYGVVYGDAGTALLLRAPAAPEDALRLRSVVTMAAPELESMHRGADPFAPAARTQRPRVDMRATKRAYLHEHGHERFIRANENAIRTIVAEALRDAGIGPRDPRLRYAVLPRFGLKTLQEFWLPILADCVDAEPLDYGRTTGHLGAGDAAAGLAELMDSRALGPGEAALVFSAGAGFTWSCLVVQAPGR